MTPSHKEASMTESEVREAVEYFNKHSFDAQDKYIQPLKSLAELWLSRKIVEKINIHWDVMQDPCNEAVGYNKAIDACRLASVVSEDEIGKIIWGSDLLQHKGGASFVDVDKLSHAIAEYVNGGGSK